MTAMRIEKPEVKKDGRSKNGGARAGAGRPQFVPADNERKAVEAMAGYGLPQEHIAVLVREGINLETLRTHFSRELVSGKAKANSKIAQTLFQKAAGGDVTSMIWWSKTQMKWSERQPSELDMMMVEKLRRELEREEEDDVLPTSIEVRVVNGGSKLITGESNV